MKKGDKVKIINHDGTLLCSYSKAKKGIVRCVYRVDIGQHLPIVLKINNRLYAFNQSNLELISPPNYLLTALQNIVNYLDGNDLHRIYPNTPLHVEAKEAINKALGI